MYDPYEIKLANEIAETLKDKDALPLFLQYTRKYKEAFLRQKLQRVMSIEESKIRKTRALCLHSLLTNTRKAIMKVLDISANSRLLALAIMNNSELHDFHVHLFKEKWSDLKVRRIITHIQRCIKKHHITHIALTIPYAHYQNKQIKKLITEIQLFCEKRKCSITTYSPKAFHSFFKEARAKKKALMESLVERYPELLFPYKKELSNKRRYYHKLFEAVAAGTLLARDLIL